MPLISTVSAKKSWLVAESAGPVKKALDQTKLIQKTGYGGCDRELTTFQIGEKVRIQKDETWKPAAVITMHESPHLMLLTMKTD